MHLPGKIFSGVRWLLLGRGLTQTVTWTFTFISIRLLTPDDFGLIAIASIMISFGVLLEDIGIQIKIIQMDILDTVYLRTAFGFCLLVGGALTAAVVACAPAAASFFSEPRLTLVVVALSSVFLLSAVAIVPDALIRRNLDLRTIAVIGMMQGFLGGAIVSALAWAGAGVWALVAGTILSSLFRAIALLYSAKFYELPLFRISEFAPSVSFSVLIFAQRLVAWMSLSYDKALLGRFFDGYTVGLYATTVEIARLPLDKIGSTINTVVIAGLARMTHDLPTFRYYLLQGLRLIATLAFPTFFGISLVCFDLIPILLGSQWAPIAPLVAAMTIAVPFRALGGPMMEAMNSLGRARAALQCTLVNCGFTICAMSAGIAMFGLYGVVGAWMLTSITGFAVVVLRLSREAAIRRQDLAYQIVPALASACLMYVVVRVTRDAVGIPSPSPGAALMCVAVGVAVYLTALALLDKNAIYLARSLLRRP